MIGFDIDGTLTSMEKMIEVFNRETGKLLTLEDIKEYRLAINYGISNEEERRIWELFEGEIVSESTLNKQVVNLYHELSKSQPLVIITARKEKYREATINWLTRNNILYNHIEFGHDDKAEAFKRNNIEIFYDDRYENVLAMNAVGGKGILVNQPYNKHYDYHNRV